jgi:hypothetical protein
MSVEGVPHKVPGWIWPLVATVLVFVATAAILRLRWIGIPSSDTPSAFDTWTARFCYPGRCAVPSEIDTLATAVVLVFVIVMVLLARRRTWRP